MSSCIAIYNLCIPVEDWQDTFTFVDADNDDAAVDIDDARAQIYGSDDSLLFDLTVGDGITISSAPLTSNQNILTLAIAYADIKAYNDSVSNAVTTGYWDLLVQRNVDSLLKRYLRGTVDFPKLYTPSIS